MIVEAEAYEAEGNEACQGNPMAPINESLRSKMALPADGIARAQRPADIKILTGILKVKLSKQT